MWRGQCQQIIRPEQKAIAIAEEERGGCFLMAIPSHV
jgi:hypothetical protein